MEAIKKYIEEIYGKHAGYKKISPVIKKDFDKIYDMASDIYTDSADQYFGKREKYNTVLIKAAAAKLAPINKELKEKEIKFVLTMMSSVSSGTNLIGDSDVDYGLLVDQLDIPKIFQISTVLSKFGFVPVKYSDQGNKKAFQLRYGSTLQIGKKSVDIEIKVRDYAGSLPVLKLHKKLDSLPIDKKKLITYLKRNLQSFPVVYKKFKSILFSRYFCSIPGSYFLG
jgi:hypothetical protein